jgi:hypothetical protein
MDWAYIDKKTLQVSLNYKRVGVLLRKLGQEQEKLTPLKNGERHAFDIE